MCELKQVMQLRFKLYSFGSVVPFSKILYDTVFFCFKFQSYYKIKIKKYVPSYRTDGTKNCHLRHSASRMPNPSSLPDHGFKFKLSLGSVCLTRLFSQNWSYIYSYIEKCKTCGAPPDVLLH